MDNLCHTLVGAAMSRAGLRSRTRLAGATLMAAANLPDLDVLVFATSEPSIAFRRGWTHGVLAQALLPVALVGVVLLTARRRKPSPGEPPLSVPWLLALSYLGLYSHVFLDYLNTYGIRLLAPFDWHWFYGDAVFILDPWLWLTLGIGVWLSRRGASPRPAAVALLVASVYIGAMVLSASLARSAVLTAWESDYGSPPRAVMVGPVPVNPFERQVIVDAGSVYRTGTFSWTSSRLRLDPRIVAKNDGHPEVAAARNESAIRAFLVWSRFPVYEMAPDQDGGVVVSVGDMRFADLGALRDVVSRARFVARAVVPRSD